MTSDNWIINDQNAVYFLTFTIVDWVDVFTRKQYKNVITDSLNYCIGNKGLEVFAWCLMSNHLHLVCRSIESFRISDTIRDFKKFTAKSILEKIETEPESRRDWRGRYSKRAMNLRSCFLFIMRLVKMVMKEE